MTKEVRLLNDIMQELHEVSAILNDPVASKGKLTVLKSAQRKLYGEMMRHPSRKAL